MKMRSNSVTNHNIMRMNSLILYSIHLSQFRQKKINLINSMFKDANAMFFENNIVFNFINFLNE